MASSIVAGAFALVSACGDARRVESTPPSVGSAEPAAPTAMLPAGGEPLCGGHGEACCTGALPPCNVALVCDVASSVCVPEDTGDAKRLCANEGDCGPGQRCCSSGVVGICQPLDGSECPLPDLAIYADGAPTVSDLGPLRPGFIFSNGYACAQEKQCVNGPGPRRVLRASLQVANVGAADMILGAPGASPDVKRARCNGSAYADGFLRFELLDMSGGVVARTEGRVPLGLDQALYDSELLGLKRSASASYGSASQECAWVDITGVRAGAYRLRVSVNPDQSASEMSYANNVIAYPVTLPAFDQLSPCTQLDANLSDFGTSRWCGWALEASDTGLECVPGEPVVLGCPSCTGLPALRVCNGTESCSFGEALAADPAGFAGEIRCPTATFECPASGRYSVMTGPDYAGTDYFCPIAVGAPADAGLR